MVGFSKRYQDEPLASQAMGFCQSASPSAHGQKTPKMVMLDPANDPKNMQHQIGENHEKPGSA